MERQHGQPVQPSREPAGEEDRPLLVAGSVAVGQCAQLEPGLARHLHLGAQPQQSAARGRRVGLAAGLLDGFDAPEVDRITDPRLGLAAASAAEPDSADEPVHPAAHRPEELRRVPAVRPADADDHPPQSVDRGRRLQLAGVGEDGAARPVRVAGQRVARGARDLGILPARLDGVGVETAQRHRDGGAVRGQPAVRAGDEVIDRAILHDALVLQRSDERARDRSRNRGHQVHPVRCESRSEHRQGGDRALAQTRLERIAVHHLAVAQHVGSADVGGAVDAVIDARGAQQVVQHVAHRDRLDAVAHPFRRRHVRQHVGQVPDHLERCGTGADHDAGLQHERRNARLEEDLAHPHPGAQMRRELHVVGVQSAEIHDAAHSGLRRGIRHRGGRSFVALLEPLARRHRVDQVVDHVDIAHGLGHGVRVVSRALDDLAVGTPREGCRARGVPGQCAHPVSGVQQTRRQPPADVSRGAEHQRARRRSIFAGEGAQGLFVPGGLGELGHVSSVGVMTGNFTRLAID